MEGREVHSAPSKMADKEAKVRKLLLQKRVATDFRNEEKTSEMFFITIIEKDTELDHKLILKNFNLPKNNYNKFEYAIANHNKTEWHIITKFKTEIPYNKIINELKLKYPNKIILVQGIINIQKACLFISGEDVIDMISNIKSCNFSLMYQAIQYFKTHPEIKILSLTDEYVLRNLTHYSMLKHLFEFYKGKKLGETFDGYKIKEVAPIGWPLNVSLIYNEIVSGYSEKIIYISGEESYGKSHFIYKILLVKELAFVYDVHKSIMNDKQFKDFNVHLHKYIVVKDYDETRFSKEIITKLISRKLKTTQKYSWEPEPSLFRGPIIMMSSKPPPEWMEKDVHHVRADKKLVQLVTQQVKILTSQQQVVSRVEKQVEYSNTQSGRLLVVNPRAESQPSSQQALSSPAANKAQIPCGNFYPPALLPAPVCKIIDIAPPTPPISQQSQDVAMMSVDEQATSTS